MSLRGAVIAGVRATQGWPVLGSLYRGIYARAAEGVARLAAAESGAVGLYARNSYATGQWEPGRSDIDLTLIWDGAERGAVERFHSGYGRLKRWYPMLGEVEMLEARHLDAWTAHGWTGREARTWKRLWGGHEFVCRYGGDERMDRVRHAVATFRYDFLAYWWARPRRDGVVERVGLKIFRCLGEAAPGVLPAGGWLEACLDGLSKAVRGLGIPGVSDAREAEGVLAGRHQVVRKGWTGPLTAGANVMYNDVLRFYLSSVDPLEYFTLMAEGGVLGEPVQLRPEDLRETVCHYSVHMLSFPFRENLHSLSDEVFRNLLYGWFLRSLRYLEDGVMEFDYGALRAYFGERHGERVERYALLLAIADDLSARMQRG